MWFLYDILKLKPFPMCSTKCCILYTEEWFRLKKKPKTFAKEARWCCILRTSVIQYLAHKKLLVEVSKIRYWRSVEIWHCLLANCKKINPPSHACESYQESAYERNRYIKLNISKKAKKKNNSVTPVQWIINKYVVSLHN